MIRYHRRVVEHRGITQDLKYGESKFRLDNGLLFILTRSIRHAGH